MTPEQIEGWRVELERAYGRQAASLCDLALKGQQVEAMREAIRRNVGRMRDDMKFRGYLRVGTLTSALDALSQSLNPKNEEEKEQALNERKDEE
jgi:hypothetical protein